LDYLRCGETVVNKHLPQETKWRIWVEAEQLRLNYLADEFRESPCLGPLETNGTWSDERGTWSSRDHEWISIYPLRGMSNYNPDQKHPAEMMRASIPHNEERVAFRFSVKTLEGMVEYDYFVGVSSKKKNWLVNCGLKTHYGHKVFLKFTGCERLDISEMLGGDPTQPKVADKTIQILPNQFLPTHGDFEVQILVDRRNRNLVFRNPNLHMEQRQTMFDSSSIVLKMDKGVDLDDLQAKVIVVACVSEGQKDMRLLQKLSHCPLSEFKKYTDFSRNGFQRRGAMKMTRPDVSVPELSSFDTELDSPSPKPLFGTTE